MVLLDTQAHPVHLDLIIVGHQVLLGKVANGDLVGAHKDGMLGLGGKVASPLDAGVSGAVVHPPSVPFARRLVELYANPNAPLSNARFADEAHCAALIRPNLTSCPRNNVGWCGCGWRRCVGQVVRLVGILAQLVRLEVCTEGVWVSESSTAPPFFAAYSASVSSNFSTWDRSENSPGRALGSELTTWVSYVPLCPP